MGRRILKKLKSNEGASITFALLAFLVCAVISAVLLASASAATGRLSNLAESDQRYYAVTSAAQLFCDALEGQEFTVERKWTSKDVSVRKYTEINGIVVSSACGITNEVPLPPSTTAANLLNNLNVYGIKLKIPGSSDLQTDDSTPETLNPEDPASAADTKSVITGWRDTSIFADAAMSYVIGTDAVTAAQAYQKKPGSAGSIQTAANAAPDTTVGDLRIVKTWENLNLVFSPETGKSDTYKGVPIAAKVSLRNDGSMLVELSADDYKVTVTLTATVKDDSALPEVTTEENVYRKFNVEGTEGNMLVYNYETTVIKRTSTKTTAISWHVTEIKKGAA